MSSTTCCDCAEPGKVRQTLWGHWIEGYEGVSGPPAYPFGGRSRHVPPFPDRKTTSNKQVKNVKNETNKRETNTKQTLQKIKKQIQKNTKQYQTNIANNTETISQNQQKHAKKRHENKCQKLLQIKDILCVFRNCYGDLGGLFPRSATPHIKNTQNNSENASNIGKKNNIYV